jgi:DNA repair ATPase RecN
MSNYFEIILDIIDSFLKTKDLSLISKLENVDTEIKNNMFAGSKYYKLNELIDCLILLFHRQDFDSIIKLKNDYSTYVNDITQYVKEIELHDNISDEKDWERLKKRIEELEELEKKFEEENRNFPNFSEPKTKENDYDPEEHFFRIAKYGDMDTWK